MLDSPKVVLTQEPDFVLGRLTGFARRRELVRDDGESETVEHRVMQVLIALAKAGGDIVTRDELAFACWDGRIVSEDAINRVISRLRKLADGIGAGSFEIETITKVGYRLKLDSAAPEISAPANPIATGETEPSSPTRRRFFAGATAGVLAAIGGALLYRRYTRGTVAPEVERLVAEAQQLADQNTREGQYQAIGLLRRVVAMQPDYAEGWGRLGIAYAVPSHYRQRPEGMMLRARAEAAGRRALELDPGNAFGELALGIAVPFVGAWRARDQHFDRAMADRPDDDTVLLFRAVQFIFVGRASDAVQLYERIKRRPLTPASYNNYIHALWCAGRMEEADRAMDDAASLYPAQATIWFTRFHIRMFGGRPEAAIAHAENPEGRPTLSDDEIADLVAQARAVASRDPRQAESVMASYLAGARKSANRAEYAIRLASALGRLDEAFAVADAYYFGRGFRVPDFPTPRSSVSQDQRQTRLLFEPGTRPMRQDARFAALIQAIGFARYWQESGTRPDYLRV